MAENLFPADELEIVADELDDEEDSPVGYMESVYFDEDIGDLARDGQYRLKGATGLEAWEQWCRNCLATEKGAYPAYGDRFGISTYEAFASDSREETESLLRVEITEGLMNDPYGRTEYVEEIEFNWLDSSSLQVVVTVRGIADATIDITVLIDQRAR